MSRMRRVRHQADALYPITTSDTNDIRKHHHGIAHLSVNIHMYISILTTLYNKHRKRKSFLWRQGQGWVSGYKHICQAKQDPFNLTTLIIVSGFVKTPDKSKEIYN
jgi:hypothetical protein